MKESTQQVVKGEEITLKEIILKIQEYFKEVLKYWWFIGFLCLLTSSYFLYKHFTFVPTYNAELRFVVEGQGRSGGGLSSLLGSFGISKSGKVNPYKILEVGRSNKLFENIAFSKYKEDTTFADKILAEYDLINQWSEKNPKFKDFQFTNDTISSSIEKKVFKKLRSLVWGGPESELVLSSISLDEEKGIYSLRSFTTDEELSIAMTNKFYQGLKQFFEDEVFENQKKSAQILAAKADSINALRTSKIYELARFEDRNQGLLFKEDVSRQTILSQEIQVLSVAYGEILKNYEMTDINLKDLQPLFMEIDKPFSPLTPSESSLPKNLLLGLVLGGFLGSLCIVIRKIFKDVMK